MAFLYACVGLMAVHMTNRLTSNLTRTRRGLKRHRILKVRSIKVWTAKFNRLPFRKKKK